MSFYTRLDIHICLEVVLVRYKLYFEFKLRDRCDCSICAMPSASVAFLCHLRANSRQQHYQVNRRFSPRAIGKLLMCSETIQTHCFVPPFSLSCSCCLHSCSLFTSPPTSCTPQNMGAAVLNIPYELVQPTFIGSVNPLIIPGTSITCSSNGTTDERFGGSVMTSCRTQRKISRNIQQLLIVNRKTKDV